MKLHHLLRRYGLLVLLTVLGALAGGVYDLVTTPTYVAKSYVVVTAAQGDSQSAINFAQAYGRIVTTQSVTSLAAASLGSGDGLSGVTASTSPDAPVVEITASGPGAQHTAAVANAMAQALVKYGSTRTESTRVTLSVLALAAVPTAPASPKPPLEAAIGALGGLLVGGLALLAGVGTRRARTDEAQEIFGPGRPVAQLELHPATQLLPLPARPAPHYLPAPERLPASQYLAAPDYARPAADYPAAPDYARPAEPPEAGPPVVGRAMVIYREPR